MLDNLLTATDSGLFADFDQQQIAAIAAQQAQDKQAMSKARAIRTAHRMQMRRATSEKHLAEVLPERFEAGESWHVISHGDVDALSYLAHTLKGVSHFDYVLVSTWCIARADLEQIAQWLDAGLIDQFDLYAGEIFPSQYGDEYEMMLDLCEQYGCKLVIARNHSKVILTSNEQDNYHLVVESSCNVNTNPRIEQAAVHASRDLFEFYREFFSGIRSIDRATKGQKG